MRPARSVHGADVYGPGGELRRALECSSTVPRLPPPRGWRRRARRALDSLGRYPRPHGRGLEGLLLRGLGPAAGAALATAGASQALDLCARASRGRAVRVLAPCFGEVPVLLAAAGARVSEVWWDSGPFPGAGALLKGLRPGSEVWVAQPSNPEGRLIPEGALRDLARAAAGARVTLLVDEALRGQRLDAPQWRLPGWSRGLPVLWVRSLGKAAGLPGLRLGCLAGPRKLVDERAALAGPWDVGSLAQELLPWLLEIEERDRARRARVLGRWSFDLRGRLQALGLAVRPGSTGYFCVDLGRPAGPLARRLGRSGILVRDGASFGPRARTWLRLNPGPESSNRRLARALARALGRGWAASPKAGGRR